MSHQPLDMGPLALPNYTRHQFPLTPSPTSPFCAHRQQRPAKAPRHKPYHRPTSELKLYHPTGPGTVAPSPFSPFTPTSLSSSSSSADSSYQQSQLYRSQSSFVSESFPGHTPQDSFESLWSYQLLDTSLANSQHPPQRGLQRAESAPALLPFNSYHQPRPVPPSSLKVPIFAPIPEAQPASSPLVFSAEYIDAHLAKHGGPNASSAPKPAISYGAQSTSALEYQDLISVLGGSMFQSGLDVAPTITSLPFNSNYVSMPTGAPFAVKMEEADDDAKRNGGEKQVDEEKKQKYAVDLIEAAIKTLHKIWPETDEPEHVPPPGPVTSDGRLRALVPAAAPVDPPACKHLGRIRRKANHQQFTPDSSPDASKDGGRKRKRGGTGAVKEELDDDVAEQALVLKKRCCADAASGSSKVAIHLKPKVEERKAPSTPASTLQSNHHITLRLFVRELLRRSKTSCNTLEVALCYLDGIEETVRKLRDCLKLGIAFGTVAMAERGPYDEGMKDEGRIIKIEEFRRLQVQQQEEEGIDVRGDWHCHDQEWMPMSPASDTAAADSRGARSGKAVPQQMPSSTVLATHPLLDARRTFLASLVLATKFIQDKAYSNKAWAKLSGLAGKEVGRCERALGGALQWRLWVGKDYETGSSIRAKSPCVDESDSMCSGESDSVVHGENDPVAMALMAQAMERHQAKVMLASSAASSTATPTVAVEDAASFAAGPAPAFAPAQAAADLQLATRVGCGRARTWPLLDASLSVAPLSSNPPPLSATLSCGSLADQLSAVNLQSIPSSHGSWLQVPVPQQHHFFPAPITYSSPLGGSGDDDAILDALLRSGDCATALTTPATVRMTVDDCNEEKTPLATPYLSMGSAFPTNDLRPLPGSLDSWFSAPSFPFTFSVAQKSSSGSTSTEGQQQQQQRQLSRSQSLGSRPLLHPQTAALRASGGSGSSSSPHSSSTFSSPEVLTPINSRSSTLIDALEYGEAWRMGSATCIGQDIQKCVDGLYGAHPLHHQYQGLQAVL